MINTNEICEIDNHYCFIIFTKPFVELGIPLHQFVKFGLKFIGITNLFSKD